MSVHWLYLSLFCAASFNQSKASAKGVSLLCKQQAEAQTVTVNCTIDFKVTVDDCRCEHFQWSNSGADISCGSDSNNYHCTWDNRTFVSLTILHVKKEENYTISIETDCGSDSSTIEVKLTKHAPGGSGSSVSEHPGETPLESIVIAVVVVVVALVLVILLYFVFRRRKERFKSIKKKNTAEDADTAGEGEEEPLKGLKNCDTCIKV